MIVELGNDVNEPESLRQIQRLVRLLLRDVALKYALHTGERARRFVLSQRIRLERNGSEERLIDHFVSELDLIGWNQIAFPELERPAFDRDLIGERAEDEATIRVDVVVYKKLFAAFE